MRRNRRRSGSRPAMPAAGAAAPPPERSGARSPEWAASLFLLLFFEQLEKAIFQRLVPWGHFVNAAAVFDQRFDQVGHAIGIQVGESENVAFVVDRAESGELILRALGE